jgi:hypothetical protein
MKGCMNQACYQSPPGSSTPPRLSWTDRSQILSKGKSGAHFHLAHYRQETASRFPDPPPPQALSTSGPSARDSSMRNTSLRG